MMEPPPAPGEEAYDSDADSAKWGDLGDDSDDDYGWLDERLAASKQGLLESKAESRRIDARLSGAAGASTRAEDAAWSAFVQASASAVADVAKRAAEADETAVGPARLGRARGRRRGARERPRRGDRTRRGSEPALGLRETFSADV